MQNRLALDISRCAGRFDFKPDGRACEQRDTCARYLAATVWDKRLTPIDRKRIPAVMARDNCDKKIEVGL